MTRNITTISLLPETRAILDACGKGVSEAIDEAIRFAYGDNAEQAVLLLLAKNNAERKALATLLDKVRCNTLKQKLELQKIAEVGAQEQAKAKAEELEAEEKQQKVYENLIAVMKEVGVLEVPDVVTEDWIRETHERIWATYLKTNDKKYRIGYGILETHFPPEEPDYDREAGQE